MLLQADTVVNTSMHRQLPLSATFPKPFRLQLHCSLHNT